MKMKEGVHGDVLLRWGCFSCIVQRAGSEGDSLLINHQKRGLGGEAIWPAGPGQEGRCRRRACACRGSADQERESGAIIRWTDPHPH